MNYIHCNVVKRMDVIPFTSHTYTNDKENSFSFAPPKRNFKCSCVRWRQCDDVCVFFIPNYENVISKWWMKSVQQKCDLTSEQTRQGDRSKFAVLRIYLYTRIFSFTVGPTVNWSCSSLRCASCSFLRQRSPLSFSSAWVTCARAHSLTSRLIYLFLLLYFLLPKFTCSPLAASSSTVNSLRIATQSTQSFLLSNTLIYFLVFVLSSSSSLRSRMALAQIPLISFCLSAKIRL